jgi:hypothetical protein
MATVAPITAPVRNQASRFDPSSVFSISFRSASDMIRASAAPLSRSPEFILRYPDLMAQADEVEDGPGNPSHTLDMVTVYTEPPNSEAEADIVRGILDANGIPSIIMRPFGVPSLGGVEVRVPQGCAGEAQRVIAEQRAAGPEAAAEAERAGEENR